MPKRRQRRGKRKIATIPNTAAPSPEKEGTILALVNSGSHVHMPCLLFHTYNNLFTMSNWRVVGRFMIGNLRVYMERKCENQVVSTRFNIGHCFEDIDNFFTLFIHSRTMRICAPPLQQTNFVLLKLCTKKIFVFLFCNSNSFYASNNQSCFSKCLFRSCSVVSGCEFHYSFVFF